MLAMVTIGMLLAHMGYVATVDWEFWAVMGCVVVIQFVSPFTVIFEK